jgi:hypothetical protein
VAEIKTDQGKNGTFSAKNLKKNLIEGKNCKLKWKDQEKAES